jgi:hypothetical protein
MVLLLVGECSIAYTGLDRRGPSWDLSPRCAEACRLVSCLVLCLRGFKGRLLRKKGRLSSGDSMS